MKLKNILLALTVTTLSYVVVPVNADDHNEAFDLCRNAIDQHFVGDDLSVAKKKIRSRSGTVKIRYRVTRASANNDQEQYTVKCVVKKGSLVKPLDIVAR